MSAVAEPVRLGSPGGTLEAAFLPGLGMVGSSLRFSGQELLGQRQGPQAYAERKSTFGIPLLHPWANRLSAWEYEVEGRRVTLDRDSPVLKADPDTGLPIHGALAACPYWDLRDVGSQETEAWAEATLDYGAHSELMAVFPFAHRLDFRAAVTDRELSVRLSVTATGGERVPISFGLHPYLTLPGGQREDWEVELPARRRALLDDHGIPTGGHDELGPDELSGPLGERTFDDNFDELSGDPPTFSLAGQGLRIELRYDEGYPIAQAYAPEGSSFIAFEPMTAPVDALRTGRGLRLIDPGDSFTAHFTISVAEL
ncbi:MAG TPA: aldose 1-epimerase [Solirubrobacteraceae bacterium]|nr:aldose 1-epimerase [Solirubrobacteraceae bacterium]